MERRGAGMARRRADLIARDQMGKAVSRLNQKRMQELGFDKYIWRTVGDERVRPEHQMRDGKVFSWSDPPSDGHPGEPINCRCSAEPVFEDVLKDLGVDDESQNFNQQEPVEWDLGRKEEASQAGTIREAKSLFQRAKESAKDPGALEKRLAEIADLDEPTEFDLRNPKPTVHEIANALDQPNAPPKAREAARLLREGKVKVDYLDAHKYAKMAKSYGISPSDRAFTDGETIYVPDSTKGKITLVAHEVSHVVDIQLGLGYSLEEEETSAWLFESDVRRMYGQEPIVTTRTEALEIYKALYADK